MKSVVGLDVCDWDRWNIDGFTISPTRWYILDLTIMEAKKSMNHTINHIEK